MKALFFAAAMTLALGAQAALVTAEQGTLQLEGINLNKTLTVNDAKGNPTSVKMDLLGAGLRSKKVLFVNAKVYVAQLFSDNKGAFSRDQNALSSLVTTSKAIALKLTMKRTVDVGSLVTSFKDGLKANGHALEGELASLMSEIEKGSDAIEGKDVTLLVTKNSNPAKVNLGYEDAKGQIKLLVVDAKVASQVLSIWLGNPADDGLKSLKEQMLKPVY